jgi:hypothetical protein
MRVSGTFALLFLLAAPLRGAQMRLGTAFVLVEPGQAAPVLELRSVAANGNVWALGINGWTLAADIERPVEKGRRAFASLSATPYDAHSSRRVYQDGVRARDLEFDAASYLLRGGLRLRESERATTEIAAVAGREVAGDGAPSSLREAWRSPFAGVTWTQRYRRVTADDPFAARIHGIDLGLLAEVYGGRRMWSRVTLSETAGRPAGAFHLRQSAMLFAGSGIDRVNAFSIGGSWDVLGPSAVYGTHYAEYRPSRGVVVNGGADYRIAPSWELGARISAFGAPSIARYGSALQTTIHFRGMRLTAGAAKPFGGSGANHPIAYAVLSAAAFRH